MRLFEHLSNLSIEEDNSFDQKFEEVSRAFCAYMNDHMNSNPFAQEYYNAKQHIMQQNKNVIALAEELNALKKSKRYRIGGFVTYPLRKIRDLMLSLLKKLRNHRMLFKYNTSHTVGQISADIQRGLNDAYSINCQ